MATLSTYKTLVQNEVDDSSARAGAIIERAIQDTYQEILRYTVQYLANPTEETIVATPDQRYVTPTTSFQIIDNVLWKTSGGTDYTDLGEITKREYYETYVNSSSGDPLNYYLGGTNIYFDIAPSTAGTVLVAGFAVQNELSGAQTSLIPDRYTNVLLLGSIARFKAYEGIQDAREYDRLYRGPYGAMGTIAGALEEMLRDLERAKSSKSYVPKLFGL